MSSRTRIVVLHMKEIIYTAIFAALAILLIILLIVMFRPSGKSAASGEKKQYTPGVYTSTLTLNNTNLEVEVAVTDSEISSIRFSNLDETVTTMFSLHWKISQIRSAELSPWRIFLFRKRPLTHPS